MPRCKDCGRLKGKGKNNVHICPDRAWNKGVTGYPTSKKGKKYPDFVPWNKGSKMTTEQKERMNVIGLFKKGSVPWNKGRDDISFPNRKTPTPFSKKHRESLSQSLLGHPFYGKKEHTEETKKQMSETHTNRVKMGLHPWGDGTRTLLRSKIRGCYKYRQWRSDIFTNDKYTCQECGVVGGQLHADHINPFAVILTKYNIKTLEEALNCEELWNLNNGRTLCVSCHGKTESYLNRWYISPLQLSTSSNQPPIPVPTASPPQTTALPIAK